MIDEDAPLPTVTQAYPSRPRGSTLPEFAPTTTSLPSGQRTATDPDLAFTSISPSSFIWHPRAGDDDVGVFSPSPSRCPGSAVTRITALRRSLERQIGRHSRIMPPFRGDGEVTPVTCLRKSFLDGADGGPTDVHEAQIARSALPSVQRVALAGCGSRISRPNFAVPPLVTNPRAADGGRREPAVVAEAPLRREAG